MAQTWSLTMSKRKQALPWGGKPPKDADEARERLALIAMDCFAERGMRKAFMAEVARIAGISRPTLYSYFSSKEALMFGAMQLEVEDWLLKQRKRIIRFKTPQERLVEGVLYAIAELPKTRVLKFVADPEYIEFVSVGDPGLQRSLGASLRALEPLLQLAPELRERGMEIAELTQRTITSFLQYEMGKPRSKQALRAYMHRTLVPGAALPPL
jgi:AcrR family transcriptional regulator